MDEAFKRDRAGGRGRGPSCSGRKRAGGGTGPVPEDVYTKEEVDQLIAAAVEEVEAQIPDLVAQAVQEAIGGLDDRYVLKAGDTMTGQLKLVYGNSTMSVASTGIRVWDTTDQSNLGNSTIRVNIARVFFIFL